MTEKQPDWIEDFINEFEELYPNVNRYSIEIIFRKILPQQSTYEKTTVPNVLLYESGYNQGKSDMKREIRECYKTRRLLPWFNPIKEVQETIKIPIEYIIEYLESLLSPTDTK